MLVEAEAKASTRSPPSLQMETQHRGDGGAPSVGPPATMAPALESESAAGLPAHLEAELAKMAAVTVLTGA